MRKMVLPVIGIACTCFLMTYLTLSGTCQNPAKKSASDNTSKENSSWPKEINTANRRIIIYQPQPDSLIGNKLYSRSAVQIIKTGESPVFGAIWVMTAISADRETRQIILVNATILNVRFPGQDSIPKEKIEAFRNLLETEIPKWEINSTIDELTATLKENASVIKQTSNYDNTPPEIIFTTKPTILVMFDGEPSFKAFDKSGIQRAINTPFFVVQYPKDRQYYLYGSTYWFKTLDVMKGVWTAVKDPPAEIRKLQKEMQGNDSVAEPKATAQSKDKAKEQKVIPQIIVRTKPAELLQSDGTPDFAPIQGTQLLYMTNTDNNIFMTIDKQLYYILISGRWYSAPAMTGPWTFSASDKLPADFAKIPEGSDKDIVLASVAGTDAAKEAVMDAQIPQTAAVDRKTATCTVKYDGDPKFVQIKGALLYRAANTGSTVILSNKTYYVCESAVWFTGAAPDGPWAVATEIPAEIQKIPPEDPAYNVKYVYIYDVQPTVVYMGYVPGYMGCYVYGPTIVYGAGYSYPGWYGSYYYPRPVTWGFSMNYNPWTGWSMGFGVSYQCFHIGFGSPMYHGGWWGPPMYRPPYAMTYNHYYGRGPVYVRNTNITVNNYNRNNFSQNNIYNNHNRGVQPVGNPANRQPGTSGTFPSTKPANQPGSRQGAGQSPTRDVQSGQDNRATRSPGTKNNVYTDRSGNVYRNDGNKWEQNTGKNWQQADRSSSSVKPGNPTSPSPKPADTRQTPSTRESSGFDRQQMDRQSQQRDRGAQNQINNANFQRSSGGNRSSFGGGGGTRGGRR
ncbi:MAG: hypothetical protein NT004_18740 [Bacteroidetes bacterium]|nr:hypothetical protein [Bacteroidota bacterium]